MHTDAWHSILYAYITFKFTKSELFFLKMSLPLLRNFLKMAHILALLETLKEIILCLYRYRLNSRQFYNGKDRTLNNKDGFVTVKMLL